MFASSPGYNLFTDLRRKMGTSSSQPVQSPSRVATASIVAPPATERKAHSNPKMDDVAASQQLMDEEGTRAAAHGTNGQDMTLSQIDGNHDPSSPVLEKQKQKQKRKRKSAHKSGKNSIATSPAATQDVLAQTEVPTSSPFPFPASQPGPEFPAGNDSKHSTAIEVPDSQVPAQSVHASASPPMSSHIVPSSATKSKRTYKKSKQTKRDRLSRDTMQEEDNDHDRDISMLLEEALSTSHTPSKHKRSQVDNAESPSHRETDVGPESEGVRLRKAATADVDATPIPTKRRKIGSAKSATRVRDLIQDGPHDGNDEDGNLLRNVERTKLKRIKKPQTPIARSKNIYDIPDDDPRCANGHGEDVEANSDANDNENLDTGVAAAARGLAQPADAGEVRTPKDTSHRKPRGSLKKTKDKVHDSATPVRTPGQPLGKDDEDNMMREPASSDDDNSESEKKEKKQGRKSSTEKATPRRESGKFNYTRRKVQTGTAAERALDVDHVLNHPPNLPSTGDFTQDEEELIRRAVQEYQRRKDLEVSELVRIIQWNHHDPALNCNDGTVSGKSDWRPEHIADARESAEFWEDIKQIPTKRSLDRMKRHIRQTYHMFKSGAWTAEEDQLLRHLYAQHPNKWKVIQVGMGDRSMHDCQNRWRDYLQYGDKLKSSRWEPEEEERFIRAITTVAQRDEDYRAESGLPPVDEYTTKHINWQQVSREMDNTRSRIQVVAKWKNMQKRDPPHIQVEYKARTNKPALSGITGSDPTPRKRGRARRDEGATPIGRDNGKSQEVVDHSDEEQDHSALPSKKRGRPKKDESSVVKKAKKFRTTEPEDIVDHSDEEGHANEGTNSASLEKERRKSRKSKGTETDKPKESHKSKTRDDIEDPDEEMHGDAKTNTSPALKKRGRPRKTDGTDFVHPPLDRMESDEAKKRRKSKVLQESVEDLELQENEQSDHAESNDQPMEDVQSESFGAMNGDEPREDGNDAAQETEESSTGPPYSGTSRILPDRYLDGRNEEPRDMDENEDPIEDQEDEPRVAPGSPAADLTDGQSEADSDAASQREHDDVSGGEENEPSVTHDGPAEDMSDNQSEDAKDAAAQKSHSSPSVSEANHASVTPNVPDGEKPTLSDTTKMQWGDLYDLVAKLQERRDEEEGEIEWEDVAREMAAERQYTWSADALKTALEEMMQLLRDHGKEVDVYDLPGTVDDVMDFISEEHGGEIEEYYDFS